MRMWTAVIIPSVLGVGLLLAASCSDTGKAQVRMQPIPDTDRPQRVFISRRDRSCDTTAPKITQPTSENVQAALNRYDELLLDCARSLGRVVAKIDRFNKGD